MRRRIVLMAVGGTGVLLTLALLMQTPGSLADALLHPFQTLIGTQRQLNATLLDVSENMEPVRAAGRRLLKPFGSLRLDRIYDAPETDTSKKH